MKQVHNSFPLKKIFKKTVKKSVIIQITSDEQSLEKAMVTEDSSDPWGHSLWTATPWTSSQVHLWGSESLCIKMKG